MDSNEIGPVNKFIYQTSEYLVGKISRVYEEPHGGFQLYGVEESCSNCWEVLKNES